MSYFNVKIGPDIAITEPEDLRSLYNKDDLQYILKIMDSAPNGFFTSIVGPFNTANYYFTIPSSWGRGGSEMLMITGIVQEKEPDFQMYERSFRNFEQLLRKDPEIFKALYFHETKGSQADLLDIKQKFSDLRKYFLEITQTFKLFFNSQGSLCSWKSLLQNRVLTLPPLVAQDVQDFNLDRNRNCFVVYRKKADAIKIDLIPVEGNTVLKVSVFFEGTLTPEIINDLLATFVELQLKAVFTSGLCIEGNNCVYEVYVDPRNQKDYKTLIAKILSIGSIKDVRVTPLKLSEPQVVK